ncbi:hypothetical protein FYJ43_07620 [Cutibacterium sp. WCA-380-WT-3A]|uniref:Terminase large subunit-like ATPase domain-containing protein n=1 Tax=Cutibacterium porci TaxID=2605781 RepID=A0A7K0J7G5_9ACTN|nr:terminase large subunit [Cutibacterium porci]MSS45906.1 hypothetical protein [Cutibacterium porci]
MPDDRPPFDLDALRARDAELTGRPAPSPRWAPGTPLGRNLGAKATTVSRAIGKPLQPWQIQAASRITELNPAGSRLTFRWPLVTVQIPRQAGKTVLAAVLMITRAMLFPGSDIRHTAQLGKDASELWEHMRDWLTADSCPYRHIVQAKSGKGDQTLKFANGSTIRPFPVNREAGHGKSPDLVFVDEAWAFSGDAGTELLTAIRPSMITRRDRQIIIVSAAGDPDSLWWDDLVAQGRKATADPSSTHCHIEYAPPDDADPFDPRTWEYHPALGHLISLTDLAGEAGGPQEPFIRSYLNRSTRRDSGLVDMMAWDGLADDVEEPPFGTTLHFGADVALDRTAASIFAAWSDDTGHTWLIPWAVRPGWRWLIDELADLIRDGHDVTLDDGGPARLVIDALTKAGLPPTTMTSRDASLAWTTMESAISDATLTHTGSPSLRTALVAAQTRQTGDVTSLSRRQSHGPIDPLIAATAALHGALDRPHEIQVF